MNLSIGSYKFRIEILILIVIVFYILMGHLLCGCSKISLYEGITMLKQFKEGFIGANNSAYGPEYSNAKSPNYITQPSKWSMPTLTYSPGTKPDSGIQAIWDRPKQPVPLPKDELFMFASTPFKPECCPNAYSTSTGCACMTTKQYEYLIERGGNNVPYSQY
jgi:hypothetical protein